MYMNKLLGCALLLLVACNSTPSVQGDDCDFTPEKETIEVESAAYGKATGNAVVAVVADEKQQITNVVIRYMEIFQNGKVSRINDSITVSHKPELASAIETIEQSARKGKLTCGKDRKTPAHLQFLVKLSFK